MQIIYVIFIIPCSLHVYDNLLLAHATIILYSLLYSDARFNEEQTVILPAQLNGNELKKIFNLLWVGRDLDREQRLSL